MAQAIRATVLFGGRVQGVGFRYTAASVARGSEVAGYVRNLPDGRVEMVCEGQPDEVRAFIEAVKQEMGGHIRQAQVSESPPTGEFSGFSIRH